MEISIPKKARKHTITTSHDTTSQPVENAHGTNTEQRLYERIYERKCQTVTYKCLHQAIRFVLRNTLSLSEFNDIPTSISENWNICEHCRFEARERAKA